MPGHRVFLNKSLPICLLLFLLAWLGACSDGLTELERIKERGTLRVALIATPPLFFPDESMLRGLDYDMVSDYADFINTRLEIITANTTAELIELLKQGKAHIAIVDSVPKITAEDIITSTPYHPNKWHVIGNRGNPLPENIEQITPNRLVVAKDSGPAMVMQRLKKRYASLYWLELPDGNNRQVLEQVNLDNFKLSIINADVYSYYRHLYPEIKVAFSLDQSYPSYWLSEEESDSSLTESIDRFIKRYKLNGKLEQLYQTYFRHINDFDYVDSTYYLHRIEVLLPEFMHFFIEAANNYSFDERFLAAVSYQESHWDTKAISVTGVRGLMMLTKDTAKRVGVTDRLDPQQSIFGGAEYLNLLKNSLPEDIKEPDRSWLTLAAYNIGLGHLEDARILTERSGDDPDLWIDVEKHLPKLSQLKWYEQTRYGYARGREPVDFVRKIRRYFDILRLYQQEELLEQLDKPIQYDQLQVNSPVL